MLQIIGDEREFCIKRLEKIKNRNKKFYHTRADVIRPDGPIKLKLFSRRSHICSLNDKVHFPFFEPIYFVRSTFKQCVQYWKEMSMFPAEQQGQKYCREMHGYNRVLALLVMRDLLSDDVRLSTNALYQQWDYTVARS